MTAPQRQLRGGLFKGAVLGAELSVYSIALFCPGCNYAGLTGRDQNFDQAAKQAAAIILGNLEGRPSLAQCRMAARDAQALVAHAPSSITLPSGHRLTIDR